jgi:hypothetical protein
MLSVICAKCHIQALYAEGHYGEGHYVEGHYAEGHYAEGHYAECRYVECRGTVMALHASNAWHTLAYWLRLKKIYKIFSCIQNYF